jgi:tape measure domain-containing protein
LQQQVGAVERQAAATRRQRVANEEGDEAFRKMVRTGHASAEALRDYRERADQAARSTGKLSGESGRLGGVFIKLRTLVAPVAAFFGFREAARGVGALGKVASAAENARRALQNLYGTQAAGNRAYDELEAISKRNGLAFDGVIASAVKLKSFGLDPLNGSLQALIDQNSAVGGSMDDLDGKILGVGQAWAKQKLQGEEILQLVERGVPVWDLLQKATGKNVTELQKLSAAGKLGRDVMQSLIAEIGKANAGAAERGLSGLSGLVAQVSARWRGFLQQVADSGVTDYFKQQISSLLGSTGNLDLLAKRVADGVISTLEALRKLGLQIAAIASPIASGTLAVARHADAIVLLAKVYVGLKLTQYASQFVTLSRNMALATGATTALTAAEARRGVGLGGLAGIMAKIPGVLTVAFAAIGLDVLLHGIDKLNEGLAARQEAIAASDRLQQASTQLQQDQLRLGQQLQDLYRSSANMAVQSGDRVALMTRDQASAYQFALEQARQYFGGVIREARASGDAQAEATATARWKELGTAVTAVKARVAELNATAASAAGLRQFAATGVAEFDKLIAKGKAARDAAKGIFDGIDFGSSKGVASALDILEQIAARGVAASDAIKAELSKALADVSARDLPALKAAADKAFGAGTAAAKMFAAEVDRINLTRLGVDVDAIATGFTKVGRAAVDSFEGAVDEINKLGLTAEQRSTAIAQAFDNAFKQASTKQEIAALKAALQDALSTGALGFKEFQERVSEADVRLAELGESGKRVGAEVAEGAAQAASGMQQVASSAADAAQGTDRAAASAEDSADSMAYGAKAGEKFALSLYSVSQKALEATMATNRLAGSPLWFNAINGVTGAINEQGEALDAQIAKLQAANEEFDELAGRRRELAHQYDLLGESEINRLLQAEQQLMANRKKAAEERKRQEEEATRSDAANTRRESGAAAALEVARRAGAETVAAATSVSTMLDSARHAADAVSAAAQRIPTAGPIVIELRATGANGAASAINPAQLNQLADQITRLVVQRLVHAKSISN